MAYEQNGRILSSMFDSRGAAEDAVRQLRDIGIPDVTLHGETNEGYGAARREADEGRGFFEALGDFFFPDDDRATYAEGLSRGGYLVTASQIPDHLFDEATAILDSENSVDLDSRQAEWRNEGWSADVYNAPGGMTTDQRLGQDVTDKDHIDVVEESLRVGKRDLDRGTVRVRSYVREVPVSEDVELHDERVNVERRAVDRPADAGAFKDQSIEAHSYSQEAVVDKDARVVEEIALNKSHETRVEHVEDTIRKTEVEIEDDLDQENDPSRRRDPL